MVSDPKGPRTIPRAIARRGRCCSLRFGSALMCEIKHNIQPFRLGMPRKMTRYKSRIGFHSEERSSGDDVNESQWIQNATLAFISLTLCTASFFYHCCISSILVCVRLLPIPILCFIANTYGSDPSVTLDLRCDIPVKRCSPFVSTLSVVVHFTVAPFLPLLAGTVNICALETGDNTNK